MITPKDVPNSARSNCEVIDGQQRLASCVLLAAATIECMRQIVGELLTKGKLSTEGETAKSCLEETIETLRLTYLFYRDNIELEYVEAPKLTLSEADDEFFHATVEGAEKEPSRTSHGRILAAWTKLQKFIADIVDGYSPSEQATRLRKLVKGVLAEDCHVILMRSDTKGEATRSFKSSMIGAFI